MTEAVDERLSAGGPRPGRRARSPGSSSQRPYCHRRSGRETCLSAGDRGTRGIRREPRPRGRPAMSHRPTDAELQHPCERLIESLAAVVWEADAQTLDFTFVSRHAESLLGHPVKEWLAPEFWVNHLHDADRD